MNDFFGTTQQTAGWLMEHESVRRQLLDVLLSTDSFDLLKRGLFRDGPIRIMYDRDCQLVCFWNIDYLTGLADEGLGFLQLSGDFGLLRMPQIALEVFERELTVINYRLRGLIFDSSYYHRDFDDGSHKVLAGRGTEARAYSVGYFESQGTLQGESVARKLVICAGPEADWNRAAGAAKAEHSRLTTLAQKMADMISGRYNGSSLLAPQVLPELRATITPPIEQPTLTQVTQRAERLTVAQEDKYRTAGWAYEDWLSDGTTLSEDQLSILVSGGILAHPIRIIGPAGAGKTLLMQLMAIRLQHSLPASKIIFITHNAPMELAARERFSVLGGRQFTRSANINVTTLERYARDTLGLTQITLLEPTSAQAKQTQLALVKEAFRSAVQENPEVVAASSVLATIDNDLDTFAEFIRADFSVAIKAQNLQNDRTAYVNAATALGKLHGILVPEERSVIYDAFQRYQTTLDEYSVLDTDDVAISMLGKLSSPLWNRQRKTLGFDFIFVDEAQLFTENERKIFQYLSNGKQSYVPIVLALDEGQQFFGESRIGLALLGIRDAERENLRINYRMSAPIADLAFHIISQSTELFNLDFPDYTQDTQTRTTGNEEIPKVYTCEENRLSQTTNKLVRDFRRAGMRQIALVCFNESYWPALAADLAERMKDLDFSIMLQRGERPQGHSFVTLCRPAVVGGQEFDAVIAIGIEQGVVPRNVSNATLQTALEQQSLRDVYVTFSRAKMKLNIINGAQSDLAPMLKIARSRNLIEDA